MPDDYKPEGWEKVAVERETRFDPKRKRNYSVNRDGSIAWHEIPEGFKFDKDGVLRPIEPPAAEAPATENANG